MAGEEPDTRIRQTFDADEGPQILGQMMAEGGVWVVGSDEEEVGELKEQGDAEFTVSRGGLKRDLHLPVTSVAELIGSEVVKLEVPAARVEEVGWTGSEALGKAKDFSEAPIQEGLGEIVRRRKQDRGSDQREK